MKRTVIAPISLFFLILVLLLPGFTLPSQANQPNPGQQAQNQQRETHVSESIRRLLSTQVEAWNRGDLEGFMDGYWRSPDLTFFSGGNVSQGWQAALERYQRTYQGTGKEMGHLEFQDLKIDVLDPHAAVVTGKWQLTMSTGKKPHGLFTLILKDMKNGWHIVHDHTSSAEEK